MAQKDTSEKILESYNDVFSDIVNALLFNGKQILSADELEDPFLYKISSILISHDVTKHWKDMNIRVICIGLKNQAVSYSDLPFCAIDDDCAEYEAQLLGDSEKLYPVVTLVLYFGHDKPWNGPLSLKERLNIPKEFEPYVNDYKINLFEIAYLTQEQVELFQSDFRIVVDYFVQKREKDDYTPSAQTMKHVQETLQLLSAMTGDHRFEDVCNDQQEGGPQNMCEVLERVENRGVDKGIEIGMQRGTQQGEELFALLVKKLLECGRMEDIRRATEDRAYRQKLMEELKITL